MDFKAIYTTFTTELNTWWSANDNTPIFWENVTITPPSSAYIAPTLTASDANKVEYGSCGVVNVIGIFSVRVIVPTQEGFGNAYTLADKINNHFSNTKFSTVHTETGKIIPIGIVDNKFQINVIIPFNVQQKPRS
jgi:hypothetical protein